MSNLANESLFFDGKDLKSSSITLKFRGVDGEDLKASSITIKFRSVSFH